MKHQRTLWTVLGLTFVGFVMDGGPLMAQERPDGDEGDQDAAVFSQSDAITLTVENHHWSDMRIYALRLGNRFRLGTVTSNTAVSFELPAHIQADVSDVQLLAVPIGGSASVVSPVVHPSPGDEVVWGLQHNLALSGTIIG